MKHPRHIDDHTCLDCRQYPTCHRDGIAHANQQHCEWLPSRFRADKPRNAYDQMNPPRPLRDAR